MSFPWIQFRWLFVFALLVLNGGLFGQATKKPNFVIIFLDDAGWGDFRPFGQTPYLTPNVEKLAADGYRFNRFYVPQGICSASRSALLTGCYPGRTKMFGAHAPRERGLDPQFATLAQVLKSRGYATALFGKWHLGDHPETRPLARGFDENAGLMYSNDMWLHHPENPEFWGKYPLPYWDNGRVTIEEVDHDHQKMLTTWYTEKTVDFIYRKKDEPFFVYLPHSMPHVPLYVSDRFEGKSGHGLYGDVMMELDWSVGEVMKALDETGRADETVFLFTSDNGPWIAYGDHAGVTPFREAKATGFDGGIRSPCIVRYPAELKAGVVSERAWSSLDVMPTFASLAGASLPGNPVDGKNVWTWIRGDHDMSNPNAYYPFSTGRVFEGVLSGDGRWKLHLPHSYRSLKTNGGKGMPGKYQSARIGLSLFDLRRDPYESQNVYADYPDVAQRLEGLAKEHHRRFFSEALDH